MGSSPSDIDCSAAQVIAGAVFRLVGSSKIELGDIFNFLICSAVMNLCSSLHTIIDRTIDKMDLDDKYSSMYRNMIRNSIPSNLSKFFVDFWCLWPLKLNPLR